MEKKDKTDYGAVYRQYCTCENGMSFRKFVKSKTSIIRIYLKALHGSDVCADHRSLLPCN